MSPLTAFAFGKLPAHGDFVARGLDAAERDRWDSWASASLEQARALLGDAFAERHGEAQPWRFAFGPGPWGDDWRAGALAPSVDRTGRRFVIVAGVRASSPLDPDGLGGEAAALVEDQIYRVFETAGDIDDLVAYAQTAVRGLAMEAAAPRAAGRFWSADGETRITAESPPANLLTLALSARESC